MDDSYGNTEPNCSGLFRNLEEQRKIIEQQFVLDVIKDWAYSEQKASVLIHKGSHGDSSFAKGEAMS